MTAQSRRQVAGEPRLRGLGSQWMAAAEGAFSGLAGSPERYIAAARLVAAWLGRLRALPPGPAAGPGDAGRGYLRECDDAAAVAALLGAWDARASQVPDGETSPLSLTGAEREALTAAAFAIRYTEVAEWLALRQRRREMAAAARSPRGWVVLEEAGDSDGDPFISYRRIEADPVTGRGVLVETHPDESFTQAVHEVHPISVDPLTGELKYDSHGSQLTFKSSDEREEHVAALRSRAARPSGQSTD